MKSEAMSVRLERLTARQDRTERLLRRFQTLSILLVALMACAMFAKRGLTEEQGLQIGNYDQLTVVKLIVDSIEVTGSASGACTKYGDNTCITGSHIWTKGIDTQTIHSNELYSHNSSTENLNISDKDGGDGGGSWSSNGDGTSRIILSGSDHMVHFQAGGPRDPVMIVSPYSGKQVRVPVPPVQ
jgi:hypothetical protein